MIRNINQLFIDKYVDNKSINYKPFKYSEGWIDKFLEKEIVSYKQINYKKSQLIISR